MKDLLSTKKQKIKVAEKLIKVFANHSEGEFQLYLNREKWDVSTKVLETAPDYCKKCSEYWDNLHSSSCWQALDKLDPVYSASVRAEADKVVDYCHENHEGYKNADDVGYHGTRCKTWKTNKKCNYQWETKWSYEVTELSEEDYNSWLSGTYGNPDTITAVYDGSSISDTLTYNEFGGQDRLVEDIESVIPDGYYYENGTHYSFAIHTL